MANHCYNSNPAFSGFMQLVLADKYIFFPNDYEISFRCSQKVLATK